MNTPQFQVMVWYEGEMQTRVDYLVCASSSSDAMDIAMEQARKEPCFQDRSKSLMAGQKRWKMGNGEVAKLPNGFLSKIGVPFS